MRTILSLLMLAFLINSCQSSSQSQVDEKGKEELKNQNLSTNDKSQKTVENSTAVPIKLKLNPLSWDRKLEITAPAEDIVLVYLKEEANSIIDTDKWFEEYNIELNVCYPKSCIAWYPRNYKQQKLIKGFEFDDYALYQFGKDYSDGPILHLVDPKTKRMLKEIDLTAFLHSPADLPEDSYFTSQSLNWASIENDILYFSIGHNTYAYSSGNQNAYLLAMDLKTNQLLWQSAPLVSNSKNFAIDGDYILSGYGFTKEDDYLYLLDKRNGNLVGQTKVRTAIDWLIKREEKIYVRTYNTDYIVSVSKENSGPIINEIEE